MVEFDLSQIMFVYVLFRSFLLCDFLSCVLRQCVFTFVCQRCPVGHKCAVSRVGQMGLKLEGCEIRIPVLAFHSPKEASCLDSFQTGNNFGLVQLRPVKSALI